MAWILLIGGDYTQTAAGTLEVEIGGLNAGTDYDVMRVFGNAVLAGVLDIDLINGFDPTAAAFFDILVTGFFTPGSVSGISRRLISRSSSFWDLGHRVAQRPGSH